MMTRKLLPLAFLALLFGVSLLPKLALGAEANADNKSCWHLFSSGAVNGRSKNPSKKEKGKNEKICPSSFTENTKLEPISEEGKYIRYKVLDPNFLGSKKAATKAGKRCLTYLNFNKEHPNKENPNNEIYLATSLSEDDCDSYKERVESWKTGPKQKPKLQCEPSKRGEPLRKYLEEHQDMLRDAVSEAKGDCASCDVGGGHLSAQFNHLTADITLLNDFIKGKANDKKKYNKAIGPEDPNLFSDHDTFKQLTNMLNPEAKKVLEKLENFRKLNEMTDLLCDFKDELKQAVIDYSKTDYVKRLEEVANQSTRSCNSLTADQARKSPNCRSRSSGKVQRKYTGYCYRYVKLSHCMAEELAGTNRTYKHKSYYADRCSIRFNLAANKAATRYGGSAYEYKDKAKHAGKILEEYGFTDLMPLRANGLYPFDTLKQLVRGTHVSFTSRHSANGKVLGHAGHFETRRKGKYHWQSDYLTGDSRVGDNTKFPFFHAKPGKTGRQVEQVMVRINKVTRKKIPEMNKKMKEWNRLARQMNAGGE